MKLIKTIAVIFLLACTFLSCSSDDENILLDTWALINIENSGCNEAFDLVTIENTSMGVCFRAQGSRLCQDINITFLEDGTYKSMTTIVFDEGDDTLLPELEEDTGTWSQTGNIIETCDSFGDCINLSLDGEQLILTLNDEDDLFECSETKMIFEKG